MNDTLESIRPSCNINVENEMSYLFGRDPSILACGQRPCISEETKKNLMSVYEIEESQYAEESGCTNSESQTFQTIKVYLRLKPFPKKAKLTKDQEEAYQIQNSTTLLTKLPSLDNNTSFFKKSTSTGMVQRKFTFTHTFRPETTQLELFEQAVKQQMIDFLDGQNSTIMTYGTTNSGKSYTLQGTITSPGIIPRCLEFVFSTISAKSTPSYKPVNHCDVVCLGPLERAQELEIKTKLLTFASMDKHQYINAYKEMQKLLKEESPIRPSHCVDVHYSVWVSFAEIYNEIVYDLLSNENQKKRTPLKLVTDAQGTTFIKGLKTICVNSGSEAYQVLMAGQYNLKVAATALNARSSRSHCIFTIKLLKYYVENDPGTVEVSTFAFCDLAGSERLKKTLNIGDRLREAQNINTSLLVLGRCLKTIHDGQLTKQKLEHVGPFRESKLTRLFQKPLSGKEHVALIVNINPLPNLYIETQNVLNFAAIAKKIVLEQKQKQKEHKKKSRFSRIVTESIKTVTDWEATELESEEWQNTDDNHTMSDYVSVKDYDEILLENERLQDEIRLLKSTALSRDLEIREEMADTYMVMMKECEAEWKNHIHDVEEQHADILQSSVKQIEDFYKEKLQQLNCHKRKRTSIVEVYPDDKKSVDELEIQNSHLTSKLMRLQSNIKELNESNQALIVDKNKLTFELELLRKDSQNMKNLLQAAQKDVYTDEESTCYIEELKSQLFAKQEQVKKLKVFLNEAKEEYISVTTKERETDYIIKEQEEELLEKQELINDLEADFTNAKICLIKKTKEVEVLDEILENKNKQLLDYESKMQDMQEKINKLENDKLEHLGEVQRLKTSDSNEKPIEDSECKNDVLEQCYDSPKDDTYQEITSETEICCTNQMKKNQTEEEPEQKQTNENEIHNKSSQTIDSATNEGITQTSFSREFDNSSFTLNELSGLTIIYEDLKTQHKEKCQMLDDLKQESLILREKLENLTEESNTSKILMKEYKQLIELLNKEVSVSTDEKTHLQKLLKDSNESKAALDTRIKEYDQRLDEIETQNLDTVTELQQQIEELNKNLEICQDEKEYLQRLLDESNDKLLEFEDRLESAKNLEEEKDIEIKSLQQEMKLMISRNDADDRSDKLMEAEMKNTIRELTETKEKLSQKEEYVEDLQTRIKTFEQNAKIMELLQQSAQERQTENDRLRNMNQELKNSLIEKEREMEAFMKNRDEMVTKYETLVKNQQEELEKKKRVATKHQSKEKGYFENTSEDEAILKERRTRRPPRKYSPTSADVSVIELPQSTSKRSDKRAVLPPPSEPLSDKKKNTRKKKLYVTEDESLQDIEPVEIPITPSSSNTRSLRSKRR